MQSTAYNAGIEKDVCISSSNSLNLPAAALNSHNGMIGGLGQMMGPGASMTGPNGMMAGPGPNGMMAGPGPNGMMAGPGQMMGPGGMINAGVHGGMMMNPAQASMMMPWATMMGQMMDPSMMMWGGWGGMNLMGTTENELLPQAQREVITIKNVVLYPPPPNSLPTTTRERPPGCKTIFVGGLPETVTEEILQEMFANCGSICSLRLSKKNFAHVRFTTMEAVDKALYFSGYRMKIDDKEDKANTGRLHIDFAQARDDLHEWECIQRQLVRESRHRERIEESLLRPPSPPAVVHYSDHEAMMLIDALKDNDSFPKAVQTLMTWFDRGDCNRRTASTFYTLIQSANGHVRRLAAEKNECAEELEQMKVKYKLRLESIVNQYDQIDRMFATASKQKSWDHFTKAQRKTLELWRKQLQTVKAQQEAEVIQNSGGEAEMDLSDNDSVVEISNPDIKRRKVKNDSISSQLPTPESVLSQATEWIGANKRREENETLKCQLEALKNEVDIVKLEAKSSVDSKDKQIRSLQMALQGMQQQLIKKSQQAKKEKEQLPVLVDTSDETGIDRPEDASSQSNEDKSQLLIDDSDVNSALSADESSSSLILPAKQARLISLITAFLLVNPFGATIDHIWSYLSRLSVKVRSCELEELLEKYPSLFATPSDVVSNGVERLWKLISFESSDSI